MIQIHLLFFVSFVHTSVLFGDDASSSCRVEVKSVLFQDSLQLSGSVVSASLHFCPIFNFEIYKNFSSVSALFYSIYLFLTSFADSRVQKKPKHCKLCLSRGLLLMIMNTFLHSFDIYVKSQPTNLRYWFNRWRILANWRRYWREFFAWEICWTKELLGVRNFLHLCWKTYFLLTSWYLTGLISLLFRGNEKLFIMSID